MGINIGNTEPNEIYIGDVQAKSIWAGTTKIWPTAQPVSVSFSYTGSDQTWTVPYTQAYIITAKGAGSGDDDKGAGGGSGYVVSTASDIVLTQGGGAASGNNGSVTIVSA